MKLGFSRQSNRKADEGSKHPDRNAQFEHINAKVIAAQAQQQPVISVDTKKKELIGNFKNGGTDYRPKGDPQRVNVHDFEDKKLGKVVPYGVYDVTANAGFVSVGITSDTAEFAVQSIRCWLERMGRQRYPNARELTITADCGGSNGARVRLWKIELQKLADETGLVIRVHHYPPGTSKWNKIEHRLFCHITQNWRGRPLTDRLAVVELIGATTTKTGLKVESALDTRSYQKGIKVSKAEMKCLDITGDQFHPEWNYTIRPRHRQNRSSYCSECPKGMIPREIVGPQDRFERTGAQALRDVRPITTRLSAGLVSEFSGVVLAVAGGAMFFEPASVDLVVPSAIFYMALVLTRRVKLPMRLPKSARIKDWNHPDPANSAPAPSIRHHLSWLRRDRQGAVDLAGG